uniref:DUF1738 domain-containing protein n=1 Tax=Steinernema glaseri TaxID=37863 RepID=A0A1I7Y5D7_9BILA
MYQPGHHMQPTFYGATPLHGYQHPWTTTPLLLETCQPASLIERLLCMARSQETYNILRSAATTERREIERANEAYPLNGVFMEWATHLLQTAASRGDAPINAYQWKQAVVFIGETLRSQGLDSGQLCDQWFQMNQQLYHFLLTRYISIVEEAKFYRAQRSGPFFFRFFLCFASHFAKHAVSLGMSPSEYLRQAEELLKEPSFLPKPGCVVHKGGKKNKGWLLYLDTRGADGVFIKTLYLKDQFHPKPVQHT